MVHFFKTANWTFFFGKRDQSAIFHLWKSDSSYFSHIISSPPSCLNSAFQLLVLYYCWPVRKTPLDPSIPLFRAFRTTWLVKKRIGNRVLLLFSRLFQGLKQSHPQQKYKAMICFLTSFNIFLPLPSTPSTVFILGDPHRKTWTKPQVCTVSVPMETSFPHPS